MQTQTNPIVEEAKAYGYSNKRDLSFDRLKNNAEEVALEARAKRMPLGVYLQAVAPGKSNSWDHPVATRDFLARDGLRVTSEGHLPPSKLGDFKEQYQQLLLTDWLEERFQAAFSGGASGLSIAILLIADCSSKRS